MKRICPGLMAVLAVVVVLTTVSSWATVANISELRAPYSEVVALFVVEQGCVIPETIFAAPGTAGPRFDFHVRPTVRLKVKQPLKGCQLGEEFEIRTPQETDYTIQVNPPSRPVFLSDGDEVLASLAKRDGEYRAHAISVVRDDQLTIRVKDESATARLGGSKSRLETLPVAEGVRVICAAVERWNEAQSYDMARKSAAELVDDFGANEWRDGRIIEELVARGDGTALGTLLDEANLAAKVSIARALAKVPGAQPVPHLIRLLRAPEEWLWREALVGLTRPEAHAAVPVLTDLLARKQPIRFFWHNVGAIARVMVAVGDPDGVAAVLTAAEDPRLGYGLPDLVSAIAQWPDPRVDAFLLAHLRDFEIEVRPPQDGPPKKREINRKAAVALAKRGNDAGIQRLLEMLEEEQQDKISRQTVVALGETGDKRALPALAALLDSAPRAPWSVPTAIHDAVKVLMASGDERAIRSLIAFMRTQGHSRWLDALAAWDHPAARAALLADLNGDDIRRVCAVAKVLHKRRVAQAAERLLSILAELRGLGDTRRNVSGRYCVYVTLGEMKEKRAIPGLIDAMEAELIRSQIGAALRNITGTDLPDDPKAWRKWWREEGAKRSLP